MTAVSRGALHVLESEAMRVWNLQGQLSEARAARRCTAALLQPAWDCPISLRSSSRQGLNKVMWLCRVRGMLLDPGLKAVSPEDLQVWLKQLCHHCW